MGTQTGGGTSGPSTTSAPGYYAELLHRWPVEAVAREFLGDRITRESGSTIFVDCPQHASQSKTSLQVSIEKGVWYCHSCERGGDALHLLEFVQSGVVSKGSGCAQSRSHQEARDLLAEKAGMRRLAEVGLSSEEIVALDAQRAREHAAWDALEGLTAIYEADLRESVEVASWIEEQYGFTAAVARRYRLGWSGEVGVAGRLMGQGHEPDALLASGAFQRTSSGDCRPVLQGRVVFPYLSLGRAVYLTGRRTPWTPDFKHEQAKYKKLPLYEERRRPYVSRALTNPALWGTDVLSEDPETIILTEGVADAIAARELGHSALAVGSVSLSENGRKEAARTLGDERSVALAFDEELSGVGPARARQLAVQLRALNVRALVATLPLLESQKRARREAQRSLGEDSWKLIQMAAPEERQKMLKKALPDGEECARLLQETKLDLCDWARFGGTRESLAGVVADAKDPLELEIDELAVQDDPELTLKAAAGVLEGIRDRHEVAQRRFLEAVKRRTGISIEVLRKELKRIQKLDLETAKHGSEHGRAISTDSCRALVASMRAQAEAAGGQPSMEMVAERVFEWLLAHGARFCRRRSGEPMLFWDQRVYEMRTGQGGAAQLYQGAMYRETGIVPTATAGKTFYRTLEALAADRGEVLDDALFWLKTSVNECTVWIDVCDEQRQIAKLSPAGVEIMANGSGGIVLAGKPEVFSGLSYRPEVAAESLDSSLDQLVGRHLACVSKYRRFLLDWFCCWPLVDFAGTRPMLRCEGAQASGKSWAAKALTTLLFGASAHRKPTVASLYSNGPQVPLQVIDNLETKNATDAVVDFLLTSITGGQREKRQNGTDSGTIVERPKCLLLTNGIESIGGNLEELQNRSLVVSFSEGCHGESFSEARVLAEIEARRDEVLSMLLKRTCSVLRLVQEGALERVRGLLRAALGRHDKDRCDEFLALMYLQRVAAAPQVERESLLQELLPEFAEVIEELNEASREIRRDADPIVMLVQAVFTVFESGDTRAHGLGVKFEGGARLQFAGNAGQLFGAFRLVAKDRGLHCPFQSAHQLGRRMGRAAGPLRDAGFLLEREHDPHRKSMHYTIHREC